MEPDIDNDTDRFSLSSSSSPDPLGQPDLSSPLRTPRSRSRSRRSSSRRFEFLRSPTPASRNASRSRSRADTPSQAVANEMPTPRRSPRSGATRRREVEAAAEEEEPIDMAAEMELDDDSDGPKSPSQSFLGEATTTIVPIKSGDETPKRGRKRPGPPRRKGTPVPKRQRNAFSRESDTGEQERRGLGSPSPKPTPGELRKSPRRTTQENLFGPPLDLTTRLSPPSKTLPMPGASPGKRRRVVSDGLDDFTYTISDRAIGSTPRTNAAGSTRRRQTSTTSPLQTNSAKTATSPNVTSTHTIASSAQMKPSQQRLTASVLGRLHDPTDDHDEFDSIMESEDFTRVSLSNIPSGQYLRSLTGGASETSALANGTSSTVGASAPLVTVSASAPPMIADQEQDPLILKESPVGTGFLAGFGSGTKRAMRDALRLGDRLAKQQVEAKKAAASVEEATGNVWAELAEEESLEASTSTASAPVPSNNAQNFGRNNSIAAFPDGNSAEPSYPELPQQQPTPDQSDDHDNVDAGNEMSWKYDTPRKARLGLPAQIASNGKLPSAAKTPPVPPWTSSPAAKTPEDRLALAACAGSSPDKQLFMEQAAYEMAAANKNSATSQRRVFTREYHLAGRADAGGEGEEGEEGEEESAASTAGEDEDEDEGDNDEDDDDDKYRDGDAEGPIIINSGEVGSDFDSESDISEEPPVISDATRSVLEDDTDIWANEAQVSLEESGLQQTIPADIPKAQQLPSSPTQISSPLTMRGALPVPRSEKVQLPELDKELYPPRRGKLLSMWRRQDDSPVVYSDEPELPPAENASQLKVSQGLSRKRKLVTPIDPRKKATYNDADYSILSEFKGVAPRKSPPHTIGTPNSPTKQVRFESEDPEHPYLPTTPVHPTVEPIHEDEETPTYHSQDDGIDVPDEFASDEELEDEVRPSKRTKLDSPVSISWEETTPTPPRKGTWLSDWLPSWFKVPVEPIFSFSFPRFATKPAPPECYEPTMPDGEFTVEDHQALARLYDRAKEKPFPEAESDDVLELLGVEIFSHGWRKRVNAWELSIVEEFLQDTDNDDRFTPDEIAVRLFSIWAVDVQEGKTGLGNATAGLFSRQYAVNRKAVLAKVKGMRSMAAS